jgi:pSer/pThr/pTyr-binding forkhead associated (FHA) protein
VSSSHLRLVAEGGAVVATDLRSTNGTLVTPRGGKRRRLRPGESLVVLAGTRIDIGDGNIIEIMSTESRLEPAASPEPGKGPA